MRQAIETAPRDSTIVILEDDASGTYDVAHWSAEAGRWVGEDGEPREITPTHWHQRPRDQYFPHEDERQRRFAVFPILLVGFLVMGFMGLYFEVFDSLYFEVFHSETSLPRQDLPKTDLPRRQWAEADHARVTTGTQVKQAVEAPPREARPPVMTGPLTGSSLTNEFAENRLAIDGLDRQLQAEVTHFAQSIEQDQQRITILARKATELTASTEQHHPALEEERNGALGSELATGQREIETQAAQSLRSRDQTAQLKQAEAAMSAESIEEERNNAAALAREAAAARQELAARIAQHRQTSDEERARSAALASELATAQREIETRAAQSQKVVDAAVQQKQVAEAATAELRQSLQQEQEKTTALMQQAKAAQAMAASAEPQRRALEEAQARAAALFSELAGMRREVETQAAQSQKAVDEATKQKQVAESTIAELRQSLLQERSRTEAMARDRATAQRPTARRVAVGSSTDSHVVHVTQAVKTAATEPPKAAETQDNAEAAKLIARASALLGQGNIGAARIVLERAAEGGNAQASFMLAETYDPVILSAWGTYGTRGEAAKAREYYAKAHTGGIREAKDRLDALRQ